MSRTLMVQGTASSVGKSLVVTGLCRYFQRRGVRVAPFKAQNMSLNAAVTPDGHEIGRAQAVQAAAARIPARVEMNPILLKPDSLSGAQLVLMGKPAGRVDASSYGRDQSAQRAAIETALARLRADYELVVIEGAGSPAEINLKARDLANMHTARLADAKVILVGDIDRGGVFASLYGTLLLLDDDERARVGALLINKFRGERSLLEPGLAELQARTQKPVLGVLPYLPDLRLADEDSVELERRGSRPRPRPEDALLDIVVLRLPHLANFDDVLPLEHEPGVVVRFVAEADDVRCADLVILPGTKSTIDDLAWLRARGLDRALVARAEAGAALLGLCGGCQMLGEELHDPYGVEGEARTQTRVPGLALLPLRTEFARDKRTSDARARAVASTFLGDASTLGELRAYELHMGGTEIEHGHASAFRITQRNGESTSAADGASNARGNVVGTMLHGLFDNEPLRKSLLSGLRQRRHLPTPTWDAEHFTSADPSDRLADAIAANFDGELLHQLADI